eukprot:2169188-Rhodomonas_salina.1
MPTAPVVRMSTALSLIPMHTMPACSTVVLQSCSPGVSVSMALAETRPLFFTASPRRMATGIPEMGEVPLSPCRASNCAPSTSAPAKPASHMIAAAATPGATSRTLCASEGFGGCWLFEEGSGVVLVLAMLLLVLLLPAAKCRQWSR